MYNAFFNYFWRNILKGTVLYEVKDNVAVLTVDNPQVNLSMRKNKKKSII